ncbi:MAG: mevalonate kinase [Bdellovibrionales bacterium]
MNLRSFETRTYGKWILAGEHTVLRGGQALVFPLKSQFLDWRFQPMPTGSLEVIIPQGYPEEFKLLFWSVFEKACELKNLKVSGFSGRLEMKAEILVGSGLGASATLCVALSRWFQQLGFVTKDEVFLFAKLLEDVFHGESSGVDVAVVLSESGLGFQKGHEPEIFKAAWQPQWYLSHCGEKGITKECVQKVKALGEKNPALLERLDSQMKRSVKLCRAALQEDERSGLSSLIEALILAHDCFREWGLITEKLEEHLGRLKNAGALAVKPTGSGGGGFVLSLWATPPPKDLGVSFLPASVM